jgi:hypothetical protein
MTHLVRFIFGLGEENTNQNNMKATLEFNLPEEQAEHYCAIKGADMLNVLWELKTELRSMLKYGELPDKQYEIVEKIQDFLLSSLNDNDVNLDK